MNTPAAVVPFFFQFHEVRIIVVENDPWFVARDVCDVLEMGAEQIFAGSAASISPGRACPLPRFMPFTASTAWATPSRCR